MKCSWSHSRKRNPNKPKKLSKHSWQSCFWSWPCTGHPQRHPSLLQLRGQRCLIRLLQNSRRVFGRLIKPRYCSLGSWSRGWLRHRPGSLAKTKAAPAQCTQDHPNCQAPYQSRVVSSEHNQPRPSHYGFFSVRTRANQSTPAASPLSRPTGTRRGGTRSCSSLGN